MKTKHATIGQLIRYKATVPFSQTLNDYIDKQYNALTEKLDITPVPGQPYESAEDMFTDIKKGRLKVSTDFCENSIFGNPETNVKFRAVHDFRHYIHNKDFSVEGELTLNYLHMQECQRDGLGLFDLTLLQIEMAGQVIFYNEDKDFPVNQRDYTINELKQYGYE